MLNLFMLVTKTQAEGSSVVLCGILWYRSLLWFQFKRRLTSHKTVWVCVSLNTLSYSFKVVSTWLTKQLDTVRLWRTSPLQWSHQKIQSIKLVLNEVDRTVTNKDVGLKQRQKSNTLIGLIIGKGSEKYLNRSKKKKWDLEITQIKEN